VIVGGAAGGLLLGDHRDGVLAVLEIHRVPRAERLKGGLLVSDDHAFNHLVVLVGRRDDLVMGGGGRG